MPKYAALASPQKSPTSTTPVKSLILVNSYHHNLSAGRTANRAKLERLTSAGLSIISLGNGASTMKFPLSLTTGPAFALPIRDVNIFPCAPHAVEASTVVGDPRAASFRRTETYAKGATSMGMPCVH